MKDRKSNLLSSTVNELKEMFASVAPHIFINYDELQLLDLIGKGGGGIVLKGFFSKQGMKQKNPIAAKILQSQLAGDMDELLQELSMLYRITHPNITRFYGVCIHEECIFIIQEYIKYNLQQYMEVYFGEQIPQKKVVKDQVHNRFLDSQNGANTFNTRTNSSRMDGDRKSISIDTDEEETQDKQQIETLAVNEPTSSLVEEQEDEKLDIICKGFPPDTFLNLAIEITSTLAFIHERKIAHRDIKPQNILVDESTFTSKICDLGLAITLNDRAESKVTLKTGDIGNMGTPGKFLA